MRVIILAAGDGKRMRSDLPKVMHRFKGKPLIERVVAAVEGAGFNLKPIVVVNGRNRLVEDYLGNRALYAVQEKQLGTGHAVAQVETMLKNLTEHVLVLYGDMPFITTGSIRQLIQKYTRKEAVITLATVTVPDFNEWRASIKDFGRIVRDEAGNIVKSVEKKDATCEELENKELNPGYYCFKTNWLWEKLRQLKNNNAQGEYYLTDLVQMAVQAGEKIASVSIDPREAVGINTKEQLENAEKIF